MNRARMAERAAASSRPVVGSGLRYFPPEPTKPAPAPVRNRKAPRLTSTQRNSQGRRSEWSRSPYAPAWGWR